MVFKYKELEQENQRLLDELEKLRVENQNLKSELQRLTSKYNENSQPQISSGDSDCKVNNKSSSSEKIELFQSLFRGRTDVFAKRWHSHKLNKSGYQPHCENEWDSFLCNKKKYKCNVCPNRKLAPLSSSYIYKHLEGKDEFSRDVVGIYAMLADETCYFLAVDFDKRDFQKDILTFQTSCEVHNIPVSLEISRSGKGAHAWIFFEDKISALQARKLGTALLTYAMNTRSDIDFASYDRLFPNQDHMPNGWFWQFNSPPFTREST